MNKNKWRKHFFTIWTGQAISLITSSVMQMAIIWHLTTTTGSALVLSIAAFIGFLPQAVLGAFAGVYVDRWNRKLTMIGSDILIAGAAAALALIARVTELPIWVIMVILFVRSVGTAFHAPALNAVTPLLVPESQLVKCAGYSQSIQSISYILSPAIAAFLYSAWKLNAVIAIDVLGALFASVAVAVVKIPKSQQECKTEQSNAIIEAKEGYLILKRNKGLFALMWISAIYCFIFMPINALFPLMSIGYFGGTTTQASIVETVFAVGMLAGGMLLGIYGGLKNRSSSIVASLLAMGSALIISGLIPTNGFLVFVLCSAIMGFSAPFYNGVQTALIQEKIKPEFLGRVFGLLGSTMSLAMPFGLIVSGVFADQFGIHRWFALSGGLIIVLAVVCTGLPSIKELGSSTAEEQMLE